MRDYGTGGNPENMLSPESEGSRWDRMLEHLARHGCVRWGQNVEVECVRFSERLRSMRGESDEARAMWSDVAMQLGLPPTYSLGDVLPAVVALTAENTRLTQENAEKDALLVREEQRWAAENERLSERLAAAEAARDEARVALRQATTKKRRIPDPDGCFGPDDWAHSRCSDKCPPHGLVEPHGDVPRTALSTSHSEDSVEDSTKETP